MTQKKKVILWDFDGTLVRFTSWRMALRDVLNECDPGHQIDPEQMRPFLRDGFPWHRPEEPHLHLSNPDDWWQATEPVFARCYRGVGYDDKRAGELAIEVRKHMTVPARYQLYEDAISVLATLRDEGWSQIILSNHMPELPEIVRALGISPYIDSCLTSAATGWEKPNPKAFHNALETAGNPQKKWMIGDNIAADVKGAEAAGIAAILVHAPQIVEVKYSAAELTGVLNIIREYSA